MAVAKKAAKKSVQGKARAKSPPSRSLRSGVGRYHDQAMDAALRYFDALRTRKGHMTIEDIRVFIDNDDEVPDDVLLQANIADMWLDLSDAERRKRRDNEPPPYPFVKMDDGRIMSTKGEVREWNDLWVEIEAEDAKRQHLAKSRSMKARQAANGLRQKIYWLKHGRKGIVGQVNQVPEHAFRLAMQEPSQMALVKLTVEDALRQPWIDHKERRFWIDRLTHAQNRLIAELEAIAVQEAVGSVDRKARRTGI